MVVEHDMEVVFAMADGLRCSRTEKYSHREPPTRYGRMNASGRRIWGRKDMLEIRGSTATTTKATSFTTFRLRLATARARAAGEEWRRQIDHPQEYHRHRNPKVRIHPV